MIPSHLSFACDPQSYELAVDFSLETPPSKIELPHLLGQGNYRPLEQGVLKEEPKGIKLQESEGSTTSTTTSTDETGLVQLDEPLGDVPSSPGPDFTENSSSHTILTTNINPHTPRRRGHPNLRRSPGLQTVKGKEKEPVARSRSASPEHVRTGHTAKLPKLPSRSPSPSLPSGSLRSSVISRSAARADPYKNPHEKRAYSITTPYTWYSSRGTHSIVAPPPCPDAVPLKEGDLFLHYVNGCESEPQVWQAISSAWVRLHPYQTIRSIQGAPYVVALDADTHTPSWIKRSSMFKNKRYLMDLESSVSRR